MFEREGFAIFVIFAVKIYFPTQKNNSKLSFFLSNSENFAVKILLCCAKWFPPAFTETLFTRTAFFTAYRLICKYYLLIMLTYKLIYNIYGGAWTLSEFIKWTFAVKLNRLRFCKHVLLVGCGKRDFCAVFFVRLFLIKKICT